MILMPISTTVITKIISGFGNSAVAAIGVTGRTEMFAFMIPMALGISLVPFVSQNLGAKQLGRIREARKFSMCFAICYTGMVAVLFFIGARWIAAFFTDDPRVEDTIVSYIRIVPFGYGMMEVHRYSGFFLTGLHKPNSTAILNGIRVLVLLIPLSYFGAYCFGILGVFAGRLVTDITAGIVGIVWSASLIKSVQAEIVSEASS
jgi:Na+-driven multidrug efflux pump